MNNRVSGTIKWYHPAKHFGFLVAAKNNQEIFFHINDCVGFMPKEDMAVEFELGLDKKGRSKAIKIKNVSVGVCDETECAR